MMTIKQAERAVVEEALNAAKGSAAAAAKMLGCSVRKVQYLILRWDWKYIEPHIGGNPYEPKIGDRCRIKELPGNERLAGLEVEVTDICNREIAVGVYAGQSISVVAADLEPVRRLNIGVGQIVPLDVMAEQTGGTATWSPAAAVPLHKIDPEMLRENGG